MCTRYWTEYVYILQPLLKGLIFVNRPYEIKGIQMFLEKLRDTPLNTLIVIYSNLSGIDFKT